jgi:hypothetical protein
MKQVEYRNIDGCHLEMRVYKKNILGVSLKPVMLIPGEPGNTVDSEP